MSLAAGSRLGVYEIVSLIGAGGMGEVYRARDERLGRDVAIKVLPSGFTTDRDRLHRFEQEARAAAALNHPNILAVYDVGQFDGTPFIVSELLEGHTLRHHLDSGPLPVRKVLDYSAQIAHGLAAAHDKGIVHRDLKPENLYVTDSGRVKILDFGLAKLTERDSTPDGLTAMPTTPPNTQIGVVLGTAGYMSPEQVRGLPADHRSDIFSFGALLYEMLSGHRAFAGDTAMEAMTSVLKEDPTDLTATQSKIPVGVIRIVQRCLEKPPSMRFQAASDLAFAVESVSTSSGSEPVLPLAATPVAKPPRHAFRGTVPWIVATMFGIIAAVTAWNRPSTESPALPSRVSFTIGAPPSTVFQTNPIVTPLPSPDGRTIALSGALNGASVIWLRSVDSIETRRIVSENERPLAIGAFWSADSRYLAFFTAGGLKRVDVTQPGAPAQTIWEGNAANGPSGAWGSDGTIIFAPNASSGLFQISSSGGQPKAATTLDGQRAETGHRAIQFLPDGRHFLYFAVPSTATFVGSLDGQAPKQIITAASKALYSAGHLLFVGQGTLMAQPFDLRGLQVTGEPVPVTHDVVIQANRNGIASFSASADGVLAYRAGVATNSRLEWFDRSGHRTGSVGEAALWNQFSLSSDDRLVVAQRFDPGGEGSDIWLIDVARGVSRRFTSDTENKGDPIWSPDGRFIAFTRTRKGIQDIFRKELSTGAEELVIESPEAKFPEDWSRDNRFLLFDSPTGGRMINVLPINEPRNASVWLNDRFTKDEPHFSPDGHWIAYESTESGPFDVYVQPFSGPGEKVRISSGGGGEPRWRADGKEIFYLTQDGTLMAVPVKTTAASIDAGTPQPLFKTPITTPQLNIDQYAVSSDGQRFLLQAPVGDASQAPITVVLNWVNGLHK